MPRNRRPVPCSDVVCCSGGASSGDETASARRPRRCAKWFPLPIVGALTWLIAAGAGCDVLWRPYIQELPGTDGDGGGSPGPADDAATPLPATCAQASGGGTQRTGMTTLYIDNDPRKPWTALCELTGNQLLEYLVLPSAANNYSQYTAGGAATGTDVRTTYSAVLIDPLTLKVSCGNQQHATSVGRLDHPNTPNPIPVTSMPYGVAMGCNRAANGLAQIDLSGTPFVVTPSAFLSQGANPLGDANYSNGNRMVSLTGGGFCGWQSPKPGINNPVNATLNIELQLGYLPN